MFAARVASHFEEINAAPKNAVKSLDDASPDVPPVPALLFDESKNQTIEKEAVSGAIMTAPALVNLNCDSDEEAPAPLVVPSNDGSDENDASALVEVDDAASAPDGQGRDG